MTALDVPTIRAGLGGLGKDPITLKLTMLKVDVSDKGLNDISALSDFKHLQDVILSNNAIEDLSPLAALPHLLTLNAAHNRLTTVLAFDAAEPDDNHHEHEFKVSVGSTVHEADLSFNEIAVMNSVTHHRYLRSLVLANNRISTIAGVRGLQYLTALNLSNNSLTNIEGLDNLPLERLDLSNNGIVSLGGLTTLVRLQQLSLSNNRIESLAGLECCKSLVSVAVADNALTRLSNVKYLARLHVLAALDIRGNPAGDKEHAELRVVYRLQKLSKLNDQPVTAEMKVKARNLYKADLEQRVSALRQHLPESRAEFIDYLPDFEDDEAKDWLEFEATYPPVADFRATPGNARDRYDSQVAVDGASERYEGDNEHE